MDTKPKRGKMMRVGNSSSQVRMTEALLVYFPPELKAMLGEEADRLGVAMSELVVRFCASHLAPDRPELAIVPRKRMGRPRKLLTA